MAALTKARRTPRWLNPVGVEAEYGVKAGTTIWAGAMVALDATGFAVPAADTAGLVPVGIAQETVASPSTDSDGDRPVRTREGIYRLDQTATNANRFTRADIGDIAMVEDDATVWKAAQAANDVRAGRVYQVDGQGVWVGVGISFAA